MKKLIITTFALLITIIVFSQRPSPPATAKAVVNGIDVTINYSQPALKDRPFGTKDFHPYGKVWRNGANEATQLILSDDIKINGEKLAKGSYSFYVIPDANEWTLIFNSKWEQWGTQYKSSTDVLRVKADAVEASEYMERYTITLDNDGNGTLNWGNIRVEFTMTST